MERCVPMVLEDGAAESQDQAVAICSSKWEEREKRSAPYQVIEHQYRVLGILMDLFGAVVEEIVEEEKKEREER